MNIHLVPLSTEHLSYIMQWVNDPTVMQYFANHQTEITEQQELEYINTLLASKNDFVFSIFDGDKYVGQCSINAVYWAAKNARIFLVICKEYQRQGYGQAALTLLIEEAKRLGLHKLWLIVRKDNRKAQARYMKQGFEFEGLLKDEYCVTGTYYDMVRMGLILKGQP